MKTTNENCIRAFADLEQIDNCKKQINAIENSLNLMASALDLVGNNVRLKILYLLNQHTNLCVCDMSDILAMKAPAISQHLRKMKDRGIINGIKKGTLIHYYLTAEFADLFKDIFKRIEKGEVLKSIAI